MRFRIVLKKRKQGFCRFELKLRLFFFFFEFYAAFVADVLPVAYLEALGVSIASVAIA
jgi:hypothetical protein